VQYWKDPDICFNRSCLSAAAQLKLPADAESLLSCLLRRKINQVNAPSVVPPSDSPRQSVAWKRLDQLLDRFSFQEVDERDGLQKYSTEAAVALLDGILCGTARIDGVPVMAFAQDPSHMGGSLGKAHVGKLRRAVDQAVASRIPVVGLIDSAGGRFQEGATSLSEAGGAIRSMVDASGVVPQVYAVVGTAVGAAAYSAGMADFLIMIEGVSKMFAWGPGVMKAEGEVEITAEALGGTAVHAKDNSTCSLVARDELECLELIRRVLTYLPQNRARGGIEENATTTEASFAYDAAQHLDPRELVRAISDAGTFLELRAGFAPGFSTSLAKLGGASVGLVASELNGSIDVDATDKIARLVRTCDCYGIPVVSFIDSPGFLPDPSQEKEGIERHGARMMYAIAEATVPKVSVIVGRAYGGAMTGLCSKQLGIDVVLAYKSAEIQVLSFSSYLEIFQKKKLAGLSPKERDAAVEELKSQYHTMGTPEKAVSLGYVDRIIEPQKTREELIAVLSRLAEGGRLAPRSSSHGNMPV
jgi:acetyl-CoA carboxylase carboxyltransferase component